MTVNGPVLIIFKTARKVQSPAGLRSPDWNQTEDYLIKENRNHDVHQPSPPSAMWSIRLIRKLRQNPRKMQLQFSAVLSSSQHSPCFSASRQLQ